MNIVDQTSSYFSNINNLQSDQQQQINRTNVSSVGSSKGWPSSEVQQTTVSNDDLYAEDDLGFDPFHETQKALAEMLESESKLQAELQKQLQEQRQQQQQIQQQQQQQQNHNNQAQQQPHRHLYQHQASTGQIPNFPNSQNQRLNDDTSPPLQQLRHESPVMNRAPIGTSGGSSGG